MKPLKIIASAAVSCGLIGAPSIVSAQTVNNCDKGSIWLTAVDEIVVDGRSCAIVDTFVSGNVTATGGSTVSLISSRVGGEVSITGAGNAIVVGNEIYDGALTINDNGNAIVQDNAADDGSVVVNRNQYASVKGNVAANKVRCTDNIDLESFGNSAKNAVECP